MNDVLFIIIIVLVPVNWLATALLWRLSRAHPEIATLRERMIASVVLSIVLTIFALVIVNLAVGGPLDAAGALTVRRLLVVILTLPALYWLWLYRHL